MLQPLCEHLPPMKTVLFGLIVLFCAFWCAESLSVNVVTSSGPVVGVQEGNYFTWKGTSSIRPLSPNMLLQCVEKLLGYDNIANKDLLEGHL